MYLGLDLGTSGLKALVIDDDQALVAQATAPLQSTRLQAGWSEQDPADWIDACRQVLHALRDHLPNVKGIGLAGHMHGLVLMDHRDAVLRPCILWNDLRAVEQAQRFDSKPDFRRISGTIVFPGFSAPKMAWVRDFEPAVWDRTLSMMFPKDYLGFWLTGEKQCEPSDAAGSALFDCAQGVWSDALCAQAGIDAETLPPIIGSDAVRGAVRPEICDMFGIPDDAVVAGGAGDNAAAATGIGAVRNGQGLVSLGTSGVLLTVNESWTPAPATAVHSFCHAPRDRFIQMGVTLTATDSLTWLADIVGKRPEDLAALVQHDLSEAPDRGPGKAPDDLTFLPYLAGERTPHNSDRPMGSFIGLGRQHGLKEMTRAVVDGVAYSLGDCAKALQDAGASVAQLTAVGGGARSTYWLHALSNVLDRPLAVNPDAEHAAALGAARLGMAAATSQDVRDLVTPGNPTQIIQPDRRLTDAYQDGLQRYRRLYKAIETQ